MIRAQMLAAALLMSGTSGAAAVTLEDRLPACLGCHGEKGTSETAEVPSLGAQMAPYVLIQLYLFREGQRDHAVMKQATRDLGDADLQTFADAIAKLPAPLASTAAADTRAMENGRTLAIKYRCKFCHDASFAGRDNVPRIASQREDFLIKTLKEYKANIRHGYDGSMAEVLQPISEGEIADLATYLSRQP